MYKNIGSHVEDTAEGQEVAPGELTSDEFNPDDPHNKRLIDDGVFITTDPDDESLGATPGALDLAGQHGIPIGAITGTGSGGRITKEDVERYLAETSREEA